MKILLLTHIYPPAVDGGSQVIYKFGCFLKSRNHQIKVLTSNCHSTDDFVRNYSNINHSDPDIFRLPVITFLHRPLKLFSKTLSKGPLFSPIAFLKTLLTIINFHPDLIVAGPLPTTIVIYAFLLKKITRAKLLINASFHSTDPDFQQKILINCLKSADYLWTLTNYETKYFHTNFNIPYSKMIKVGNGVDSNLIIRHSKSVKKFNLKKINLLFIGSFASHKNIETLIRAFQKLSPKYQLTIAGKPTLHHINFPENIKVIKNFRPNLLPKILDQHDILISPSSQESFGLVLLEAMARGLPIIASNIPASTEIVTKSQSGLLFELNNPFDLQAKIKKISTNSKLYRNYSQNGLVYARQHTWDKIGETLWQKMFS